MTNTRQAIAQSRVYETKLKAIASRLEALDDKDRDESLTTIEELEYQSLKQSYKGTAMAWVKHRKANGLAYDMISVDWQ